jgi:hypothetical protein
MTPVQGGSFCDSCQKTVTDFTDMTDDELIAFLQKKPASLCGRFRPRQIKTYMLPEQTGIRTRYTLLKAGVLGAFLLLVSKPVAAQSTPAKNQSSMVQDTEQRERTKNKVVKAQYISGIVTDNETGDPMPGVSIVLKGSESGTSTDAQGKFGMRYVKPGDTLVFSFIGYESKEYIVPATGSAEIALKLSMDVDTHILGAVAFREAYNEPASALGRMWARVRSIF